MARPKSTKNIPEYTPPPIEENKPSQAENIISIVLGLAVVLVIGAMILNAIRGRQNPTPETNKPEEQTQEQTSGTHTVVAGETLWSIAEKYYNDGYKWVEIQKANNLSTGDTVEIGDKLIIPSVTPGTQTTAQTSPSATSAAAISPTVASTVAPKAQDATGSSGPTGQTTTDTLSASTDKQYTVKQGDTLWAIAQAKYNDPYRWPEIAKANSLKDPDLIYVDSVLLLP